jgi:hypothetical protein
MADDIKKFLDDHASYADTTPIRIGETEFQLGSLRQLNASERTTLSDRLKAVETKEQEVERRQQTVIDLGQRAQAAFQAAEEARAKITAQPPNPGADPFADPWLSPVKNAFDERDKKYKALEDRANQLQATLTQAAKVFMSREWQREYDGLNFGKREKKPTRDEILKYANEQKIVDQDGMPSVRLAWDKMSEGDRLEEARQQALEKGREEGRLEAMAARVTPPGVSGIGQGPAQRQRPVNADTDVLGDIYTESLKDPELRNLIEQMGPSFLQ